MGASKGSEALQEDTYTHCSVIDQLAGVASKPPPDGESVHSTVTRSPATTALVSVVSLQQATPVDPPGHVEVLFIVHVLDSQVCVPRWVMHGLQVQTSLPVGAN